MNDPILSPDDPLLTAYALGELSLERRAVVEAALKNNPAARQAVEEIRLLRVDLENALTQEAIDDPSGLASATAPARQSPAASPGRVVPFPYVLIGSLAAACFAVVIVLHDGEERPPQEQVLAAAGTDAASSAPRLNSAEDPLPAGKTSDERGGVVYLVKDDKESAAIFGGETAVGRAPAYGAYGYSQSGRFVRVRNAPLSTFSPEVDTSGYTRVRRSLLEEGRRPPRDTVRVEEMVNYFDYRYRQPEPGVGEPLAASMEVAAAPWNPSHRLVRIGLKARETAGGERSVAQDVELQVEFNPSAARSYRLIGYEGRPMAGAKADPSADLGAGEAVTALYEIVPVGAPPSEILSREEPPAYRSFDEMRSKHEIARDIASRELLTLKIRFKEPTVDVRRDIEIPVIDTGAPFDEASNDFKFAAAVATLGMILRESAQIGQTDYDQVISWAEAGKGEDADGRRGEFIEMVKKARALSAE